MKETREKTYDGLKREFTRESFRSFLEDNIEKVCCNCGSQSNVEYHHIVPLFRGGTNKLSNIVPLCNQCHKAVHFGRHLSKYKNTEHMGRPRKAELMPDTETLLWKWAKGQIGSSECVERMGYAKTSHIKDLRIYKDFIKKHDIANVRNTFDIILMNGVLDHGKQTSIIRYADGTLERCYYKHPSQIVIPKIPKK